MVIADPDYLYHTSLRRTNSTLSKCKPNYMTYSPQTLLRLPTELLREIIQFATSDPLNECAQSITSVLTQICSKFRAIALDTAPIWSTIVISLPLDEVSMIETATYLERSKHHPLDIIMDLHDPDWDFGEEEPPFCATLMEPISQLLIPHAHRWRTLVLRTDAWAPIHTFLTQSLPVRSLPNLQKLELTRCNLFLTTREIGFYPEELREPLPLFNGTTMPLLQRVDLVGVHVDWNIPSFRGLTSLRFKYHSDEVMPRLATFINILQGCPNLNDLAIVGWGPILDEHRESHSIVLPHLRAFSFGFVEVEYGIQLLRLFSMPSLLHLSLENTSVMLPMWDAVRGDPIVEYLIQQQKSLASISDGNHSDSISERTTSFVAPIPLSQLESFIMDGIALNPVQSRELFEEVPNLRQLGLVRVDNDTLRALEPLAHWPGETAVDSIACPSLQQISCRRVELRLLAQVVELRKRSRPTIDASIHSVTWGEYDPERRWSEVDRVREILTNVGVNFTVDETWAILFIS